MNYASTPATARLLPVAGHPRRARAARLPRRRDHRAQGGRLRPGHRRDARHRPGRRRVVPFVDTSLYVMTPEFGAASQLEKIDMLDFADVVAINKFERRGAEDAMRDVGRQLVRNREAFGEARGHAGLRHQRRDVQRRRRHRALPAPRAAARRATACTVARDGCPPDRVDLHSPRRGGPADRVRYLAEITETVRGYHARTRAGRTRAAAPAPADGVGGRRRGRGARAGRGGARAAVRGRGGSRSGRGPSRSTRVTSWSSRSATANADAADPRVAVRQPDPAGRAAAYADHGELVQFLRPENLPGRFPFTAGVFPFKRENEDPARMFAGEGDPARTNRRFKLLSEGARRPGCPRRSTRSPSTAATPTSARTSTARSAPPASASRRSTT